MKNTRNLKVCIRLTEMEKNDLARISHDYNVPFSDVIRYFVFKDEQIKDKKRLVEYLKDKNK
jgi:hypothetical protein